MSAPETPPAPPAPSYTGGQIALTLFGVIFLLPGLCSLFLAVGSMADRIKKGYFDPILQSLVPLWLICFAISAAGIVMIVVARRRARRPQ
jgi:Mn2+/Fe2+ NRAMP family transporter